MTNHRGQQTDQVRHKRIRSRQRSHRTLAVESLENRALLAGDTFEPNNTFEMATSLGTSNRLQNGLSIDPVRDQDYFSWTAPAAGVLRVDALFDHSQADLELRMYDATREEIAASTSLDDNERVSATLAPGQQVFFRVSEFSGFFTALYNLKVTFITADALEPNNSPATATSIAGDEVVVNALNIHDSTDQDFFRWTAPSTGKVTINSTFVHDDGDLALELFDASGVNSLASSNTSTNNERIDYSVTSGTTYLIRNRETLGGEQPVYSMSLSFNSQPTITDIPTTAGFIGSVTSIPFSVGDLETPSSRLLVSATSTNQSLVPDTNISFSGTGANRTIHIQGTPFNFGVTTIALKVTDSEGDSVTDEFSLNVFLTNQPPTVTEIPTQTTTEDTPIGGIGFTIGDSETPAAQLVVTATSSNTALVSDANIGIVGTGANRFLSLTPTSNTAGSSTISVVVTDASGASTIRTFALNVTAVNDPPSISTIADQQTSDDAAPPPIPFVVGDAETAAVNLVVTATSSNTTLIPQGNIVLGGSGANRTISVTPQSQTSGTATITVQVTDANGATATDAFNVTISTVNDPPAISGIANLTLNEDTPSAPIHFIVNDAETSADALTVTAISSNVGVVPSSQIILGGTGTNRTVAISPAANASGTTTITVNVVDENGGMASETFDVAVMSVNDLPTIANIPDQSTTVGTATAPIAFTVGDVESFGSLSVTASSSNTALVPISQIVLSGTGANRAITLTPVAMSTGETTITLQVADADGGVATDSFVLRVTGAVNSPPTISAVDDVSVRSGAATNPIGFVIGDPETAANALIVTATSNNDALIAGLTLSGSGDSRSIMVRTKSGLPGGSATVTLNVSDGVLTTQELFVVTLQPAVIGDSTNDGIFDSSDLIAVFAAGQYEDDLQNNSIWETGDWDGDRDFTTTDLIYAFQAGAYAPGASPTSL